MSSPKPCPDSLTPAKSAFGIRLKACKTSSRGQSAAPAPVRCPQTLVSSLNGSHNFPRNCEPTRTPLSANIAPAFTVTFDRALARQGNAPRSLATPKSFTYVSAAPRPT